jgi:hypothetical protein
MFAHYEPLPTVRAAEAAFRGKWGRWALQAKPEFVDLEDQPKGTDLFAPIAGVKRYHPGFLMVRDGVNQSAAKDERALPLGACRHMEKRNERA